MGSRAPEKLFPVRSGMSEEFLEGPFKVLRETKTLWFCEEATRITTKRRRFRFRSIVESSQDLVFVLEPGNQIKRHTVVVLSVDPVQYEFLQRD